MQFRTDLSLSAGYVVSNGGANAGVRVYMCTCVLLHRSKAATDEYFIIDEPFD